MLADLLDWESLYAAGRLHKPVRFVGRADGSSYVGDPEMNAAVRQGYYSLGRQLVEKVLSHVFCRFPLLAWVAWQALAAAVQSNSLWNSQKTFYKTFSISCRLRG